MPRRKKNTYTILKDNILPVAICKTRSGNDECAKLKSISLSDKNDAWNIDETADVRLQLMERLNLVFLSLHSDES